MPHPKKKIYKELSPGAERAKRGITLAAIKKMIASSDNKTRERRKFQSDGLLGVRS